MAHLQTTFTKQIASVNILHNGNQSSASGQLISNVMQAEYLMNKAVVHGFFCSDHDPIEQWIPKDNQNVSVWVDIYLGPDTEPSGEYFTFHVITHKALSEINGPKSKEYLIVLPVYSWDLVLQYVDQILEKCSGYDWSQMCDQLRKYFHWEYEGMA